MNQTKIFDNLKKLLNDFILNDSRLIDHPSLGISLNWSYPSKWSLQIGEPKGTFIVSKSFELLINKQHYGNITISGLGTRPENEEKKFVELILSLTNYVVSSVADQQMIASPASYHLGEALTKVRHDIGFSQDELSARIGCSRIALSQWERGRQPPTINQLERWCRALGLLSSSSPLVTLIDVSERLIPILRKSPDEIHKLTPSQFELFVAERLERMGFDVKLTGSTFSKDGGIDIIATPKIPSLASFLLAGQVKHSHPDRKIGRSEVDRLLAWKGTQFNFGVLITNTYFSKDALWLATQERNQSFLRLRDLNDLRRWIQDVFSSDFEWREIPDVIELAPGVTIELPRPKIYTLDELKKKSIMGEIHFT